MGDEDAEGDKEEKFDSGTTEQARMAMRDQTTAQDVLTRKYMYIMFKYSLSTFIAA